MPLSPERERELAELCRRFRIEALTGDAARRQLDEQDKRLKAVAGA